MILNENLPVESYAVDPEKVDRIIFLLEAVSGSLIEITWLLKTIFVIFLVFSAWKVVQK